MKRRGVKDTRGAARAIVRRVFCALTSVWLLVVPAGSAQEPNPIQRTAQLTILQINDVYETAPVNGLGGLARVATLKQDVARTGGTPVLVVAGDFLSSSVASAIFKGRQMIDAFNVMGVDIATLGNHEFDFGKDLLLQRMAESTFAYVVTNVLDDSTGRPVGGAAPYLVRTYEDLKVGFLGLCLASEEISGDKRKGLRFIDPSEAAAGAMAALQREGVKAIVAITHLPYEEDRQLALRFPDISVIAGGHEHFPITTIVGRTLISKAGSDAKWVARIDLRGHPTGVEKHFALVPIDATLNDDAKTAAVVAEYEAKLGTELATVVAVSRVSLDGLAQHLRTGETNLGNLMADALRSQTGADVAIVNSGAIRGDRMFPAGPISRRLLLTVQPFGNHVCVVATSGQVLKRAIVAGTSHWPASAGRFPQVSGLTFALDATRPPAERVQDLRIAGEPIALDRTYKVAIPDYLLTGGDGYDMFAGQRVLVGPEAGDLIVSMLEKHLVAQREIAPAIEGRIVIIQ